MAPGAGKAARGGTRWVVRHTECVYSGAAPAPAARPVVTTPAPRPASSTPVHGWSYAGARYGTGPGFDRATSPYRGRTCPGCGQYVSLRTGLCAECGDMGQDY